MDGQRPGVRGRGDGIAERRVGRDGASDAVAFLEVGVPAVEFGPRGGGHHGPEEYVEIESLPRYRRALVEFARMVAGTTAPMRDAGAGI